MNLHEEIKAMNAALLAHMRGCSPGDVLCICAASQGSAAASSSGTPPGVHYRCLAHVEPNQTAILMRCKLDQQQGRLELEDGDDVFECSP